MVAATKTAVFWDMEDCPIPDGLNPSVISQNIKTALVNAGYPGIVSINAFADETSYVPVDEFESARVKLSLVGEDKGKTHARGLEIMNALLRWAVRNRQSNVLIISDNIAGFHVGVYKSTSLNVLVSQPQIPSTQLVVDARKIWLRESLSAGGNPFDHNFLGVDACDFCLIPVTEDGRP